MTSVRTLCLIAVIAQLQACFEGADDHTLVGYVEADWVYLAAPQSGWLTARPVREGDVVASGALLFELDKDRQQATLADAEGRVSQSVALAQNAATGARAAEIALLEAQLTEAQARARQAVSERGRIARLVERGIETPNRGEQVVANAQVTEAAVAAAQASIDVARLAARPALISAAQAALASAQAQLDSAQVSLRERTVLATAPGRVEEVFYQVGEFVQAGQPVIALLRDDGLKVKFFVLQESLSELRLGMTVRASSDGRPEGVAAVVSFIASDAQYTPPVVYSREARQKLVFLVEATLPAGSAAAGLHPGLPVDVHWS